MGSGGVGTPLLLGRSFRGQSKVPVAAQEESVGLGGGTGRTLEPDGGGQLRGQLWGCETGRQGGSGFDGRAERSRLYLAGQAEACVGGGGRQARPKS